MCRTIHSLEECRWLERSDGPLHGQWLLRDDRVRNGYDAAPGVRFQQRGIYLAFGNGNWKSLEPGKDYPIEIQFDRNPVWNATAQAIDFGGVNFLSVFTTDVNFAEEFSRKLGMRATFNGREVAALALKGSALAVSEMLACQEAVNAAAAAQNAPQPPKDPFAAAPDKRNANDPFEL